MNDDAERAAFDEWLPNYYNGGEDSAARAGWEAALGWQARATLPAHEAVPEPYPHGSALHKEVFMALEVFTGGDTFEDGVRGLIRELKESRREAAIMRKALAGADQYLSENYLNEIDSGSILHNRMKEALAGGST